LDATHEGTSWESTPRGSSSLDMGYCLSPEVLNLGIAYEEIKINVSEYCTHMPQMCFETLSWTTYNLQIRL